MSQPVCLLAIGTAVPGSIFPCEDFIQLQTSAAEFAKSKLNQNDPKQAERIKEIDVNLQWVKSCAENSGIEKRHGVVPEEGKKLQDYYKKWDYNPPYTLRARYWRKYCPGLAMEAVQQALTVWGGDKNRITHVVSHSTTGWDVPGLSHHVMYNLELPSSARAIPVNFVGCQGGTSVIYVATMIANQNPDAVILALAAEIQSPLGRMYNDNISLERSIYMPNVLFGDAAACAVIARPDPTYRKEFPAFEIGKQGAHYIKDTRNVLTIAVSEEYGLYYENSIKKELPIHLNAALTKYYRGWVSEVLGDKVEPKDCAYAVHPGGLKLLQNFSKLIEDHGVKKGEEECQYSFKNLKLYGNLASAAILFILNDVIRNTKKDDIFFMAMGPGVCLEYGGMRRYKPGRKSTTTQTKSSAGDYTFLLLAIIMVLVGLIVGGYTLTDLKHLL
jgi:predicted naringenin-chalcone synthase